MAGKRIALRHVIKSGVDFFRRHFPGDERAIGQIGREQCLADPSHGSGAQHGDDSLEHGLDRQAGTLRNFRKRLANKPGDLVLRDGEDAGIDRVVMLDRQGFVRRCHQAAAQEKTARKWQAVPRRTNKCQMK